MALTKVKLAGRRPGREATEACPGLPVPSRLPISRS